MLTISIFFPIEKMLISTLSRAWWIAAKANITVGGYFNRSNNFPFNIIVLIFKEISVMETEVVPSFEKHNGEKFYGKLLKIMEI